MLLINDNFWNYIRTIFPQLREEDRPDSFESGYFFAKRTIFNNLGVNPTDLLIFTFLALEKHRSTAYALRSLKEVYDIEKGA